jgi:transcription antitermination factor NusG
MNNAPRWYAVGTMMREPMMQIVKRTTWVMGIVAQTTQTVVVPVDSEDIMILWQHARQVESGIQ